MIIPAVADAMHYYLTIRHNVQEGNGGARHKLP